MSWFGKSTSSSSYDDLGIKSPSVGDRILNLIGMNLLGHDFLADKKRNAVAKLQNQFLDDFAQKVAGQPIYSQSPDVQFGPGGNAEGYNYTPPERIGTGPGLNINSPDIIGLSLKAKRLGIPLSQELDILKAQQPHKAYDRGFEYTSQGVGSDQNAGFHPELDKGQEPLYDSQHRLVAVRNIDGTVQSAAELAGAVEAAKSKAQAPYQAVNAFDAQGRPMVTNAADLASRGAPFVGQSPAQTAADTETAKAGAAANAALPQTLASADQTIAAIEALKNHPALNWRVGGLGWAPALPGTPGADFDAQAAQLKGKLFLEAYNTLKGGGQITEAEGRKATEAMARLSQTQTPDAYRKALDDLEGVIKAGAERARAQPARLQPNATATQPRTTGFRSRIISVQ